MGPTFADLTGGPGGRRVPVAAGIYDSIGALGDRWIAAAGSVGATVPTDPFELVTRRARLVGSRARGTVSVGGASQLLPAADGWIAVSLARPTDWASVPAWLDLRRPPGSQPGPASWSSVAAGVAGCDVAALLERAGWLGLAVAAVGERRWTGGPLVPASGAGRSAGRSSLCGVRVVDCSSLWAGPLCARLLQSAGASVIKLESAERPDGARLGDPQFYASLHDGQQQRAVSFTTAAGRAELVELLAGADVVIEGSRPRAFDQLGIDRQRLLAGGVSVWVSITAHGRVAAPERVGFGDDAAVAGGLVGAGDDGPVFLGDAIADPLTGLAAATEAVHRLALGGRWLLDASLARTAAFVAR